MTEFIRTYWLDILTVIAFVGVTVNLYKRGKKELVRKIILSLVVQAEKALGSGTGELKYATVVQKFYSLAPVTIRILFTEKDIDRLIEEAVQRLKDMLSNGLDLLGYDDEHIIVPKN